MWNSMPVQAGLEAHSPSQLLGLWPQQPGPEWPPTAAGSLAAAHHGHMGPSHPGGQQSPTWAGPSSGAPSPALTGPSWSSGASNASSWTVPGDPSAHSAASKLYVQGLPQSLQHPVAVAGLFAPFGDVLDVKLYAAEVRLSGGSAVVRMRNGAQAAAAVTALNSVVPEGGWQQLTVRAAETAEQRSNRISAINGRQSGPGGPAAPGSPLAVAGPLPPAPGGSTAAALRRVHSARGAGGNSAMQCYTGGVAADGMPMLMAQRRSADWPAGTSIHSSRRSSMDVARCGSAAGSSIALYNAGARSSSDSGSGSDDAGPSRGGSAGTCSDGGGSASVEMQRMLLEAVLALLGQVESGQLTMPSMRVALESALVAAKQGGSASGSDDGPQAMNNASGGGGEKQGVQSTA